MSKGLMIRYEWCSGCKSCEAACRQEHNFPANIYGIKVEEIVLNKAQTYNNVPIPTDLCDLCIERTEEGKRPSCAQHCMAKVIEHGELEHLAARADSIADKAVIFKPKAKPAVNPETAEPLF